MSLYPSPAARAIDETVHALEDELIAFRRDLHMHPELSWSETRTTERVADRLATEGISVQLLPKSGLIAQLGQEGGPVVALRADLDALPVDDQTTDPWTSKIEGVAHACGHDVHTSSLLGAGIALQRLHAEHPLDGAVRLLFQPAEEVMPGGALEVIAAAGLEDVTHAYGLHCDPSLDVGKVGLRVGPITGAADSVTVRLTGRGGHTSRPHLTQDLTYALGVLVTQLPAALSRRLDPRAGASVVWGMVRAGSATNVIPSSGEASGTVRMLDQVAWADAECIVREIVGQLMEPYGVEAHVTYVRGVPPVVNDPHSTAILADAVERVLGEDGIVTTTQSLGGEDFGWYLETVRGAMGRLGTRTPGGPTFDLHQGNLRIDERAIAVGAKVLAQSARKALLPNR
jgi:amidohydrolase